MKPHLGQSDVVRSGLAKIRDMEAEARDNGCATPLNPDESYVGHGKTCDCAVCDDIAFRLSLAKPGAFWTDNDHEQAFKLAFDMGKKAGIEQCIAAVGSVAWRGAFRSGKAFSGYLREKFKE